jgi:hypothetical protein
MPGSARHSTPNALFLMEFIKNILDFKKTHETFSRGLVLPKNPWQPRESGRATRANTRVACRPC